MDEVNFLLVIDFKPLYQGRPPPQLLTQGAQEAPGVFAVKNALCLSAWPWPCQNPCKPWTTWNMHKTEAAQAACTPSWPPCTDGLHEDPCNTKLWHPNVRM